jgi:glutaredoxin/glutathione-dependent peroxiredoxin
VSTTDLLKGKQVAIFEAPGLNAAVCSTKHLTGYVDQVDRLGPKERIRLFAFSVNYPSVTPACTEKYVVTGEVFMPPYPRAELTCVLHFDPDLTAEGLGQRFRHHSILVVKGIATSVHVAKSIFESSAASRRLTPGPLA